MTFFLVLLNSTCLNILNHFSYIKICFFDILLSKVNYDENNKHGIFEY